MKQYLEFLEHIQQKGLHKKNRTSIDTISTFGYQMRYDLAEGFPITTTKKLHFKSVVIELLWFIKGNTNIKYLVDNGVKIWNEWPFEKYKKSQEYQNETIEEFAQKIKEDNTFAQKYGELGPVYGKQWRNFNGIDQLKWVIEEIKKNPNSRRLIVSSWNPVEIHDMLLPPCHSLFQFYVQDNKLSCQLYQRSGDAFLGIPFNIASYSLLVHLVAKETGLEVGEFVHTIGDAHIYTNHLEQVKEQISRKPYKLPKLILKSDKSIFDYEYEDIELEEYQSHPRIKGEVAV